MSDFVIVGVLVGAYLLLSVAAGYVMGFILAAGKGKGSRIEWFLVCAGAGLLWPLAVLVWLEGVTRPGRSND